MHWSVLSQDSVFQQREIISSVAPGHMAACWSPYPVSVGFKSLLCSRAVGISHGPGSVFGLLPSPHQSVSTIQSQPNKLSVDFGGVKGTPHDLGWRGAAHFA